MALSDNSEQRLRIGIVVGEASGDMLGAGLIQALRSLFPSAIFEGVGGPLMIEQGFNSLYPQETLAVMGLVEPLKRLPELLRIRKGLRTHFLKTRPDVFIGIDAPDFNLDLELNLRQAGIKTAHYVSPSVWAWRQGRVKKIAQAVDLMLTLFPFEAEFYESQNVPVTFVGHPLADTIPFTNDKHHARAELNITDFCQNTSVVALLPGSRASEVQKLGTLFIDVAKACLSQQSELVFLVPSANQQRHLELESLLTKHAADLPIRLVEGKSKTVMAAADVILMASGTTTLEAMLIKRPMVIAYKMAALSYWILKRMVTSKYIGLPNLLVDEPLVPEFIQHEAQAQPIADKLITYLTNEFTSREMTNRFAEQHIRLRKNASAKAATAIAELIHSENRKPS